MKKIPEEMKKAIEGDAFRFVEEKGHTDNTLVMNLETGDCYSYQLPPVNALKAAHVAHVMRKVGHVADTELGVYFSASQEFVELDAKIELVANGAVLRLGTLYTWANDMGREQLEQMVEDKRQETKYNRLF